jgi:hypothetical protein
LGDLYGKLTIDPEAVSVPDWMTVALATFDATAFRIVVSAPEPAASEQVGADPLRVAQACLARPAGGAALSSRAAVTFRVDELVD